MSIISIKNLTKKYADVTPIDNVNLEVEEGEVISIIGPSGTGKSTLLRCINRLETPSAGVIEVDGVNVCDPQTDLSEVRKKMGMVFQSFNLFGHKTVMENIMMPQMDLLGASEKEAHEEAITQLARVGLVETRNKYPDELSGGQKQRVAIARALAMHPKILLFDEPTSALDPTMVSEVLSVINDLAGTGLTMIIVTHEMRLARDISSRVIFMKDGGICEQGTPEKIFDNPEKEDTKSFIYRIKSFNYTISSEYPDMPGLLSEVDEFCKRQFMPSNIANNCRLVIEEVVASFLIPHMKNNIGSVVSIRLDAGEGGEKSVLEVDYSEIADRFDAFGEGADEIALKILRSKVVSEKLPKPGIVQFEIN